MQDCSDPKGCFPFAARQVVGVPRFIGHLQWVAPSEKNCQEGWVGCQAGGGWLCQVRCDLLPHRAPGCFVHVPSPVVLCFLHHMLNTLFGVLEEQGKSVFVGWPSHSARHDVARLVHQVLRRVIASGCAKTNLCRVVLRRIPEDRVSACTRPYKMTWSISAPVTSLTMLASYASRTSMFARSVSAEGKCEGTEHVASALFCM